MRVALFVASIIVVSLVLLSAGSMVTWRASAQIGGADSIGFLTAFYFASDYAFTWTGYDCIEARLYFNSILQSSYPIGCASSGSWSGYLDASSAAGTYQLQLWSTYYGTSEYSRSWTTPGLILTATASVGTANVGDTVGINARFTLAATGPDYYEGAGTLNVSAASPLTQDVSFVDTSAHYFAFYGATPIPWYLETTYLVPVSFGTAGTKSIAVTYADSFGQLSGSASVSVVDPVAAQIAAIHAELASMSANASANATRLAQLSGEIASLQATMSANDTQDRAALSALASQVSDLWTKLNATQASATSAQSTVTTADYLSIGALAFGAAGLGLGGMAFRRAGRKKPE
jgi:hypothetical protein